MKASKSIKGRACASRASAQSKAKQPDPDPGPIAAKAAADRSSAILKVGQICTMYEPGADTHGARCQIVEGFGLRQVGDENGPYDDGRGRFSYRPGYLARLNGIDYFMPAGMLVALNADAEYSHLRLVHDSAKVKS